MCARCEVTCRCCTMRGGSSRSEAKGAAARGGRNRRIVLAACGYMVHSCLKAADVLSEQHRVEATVVDAYSLPLDSAPILALAGPGAAIITVEDNYVGGLGSELAEAGGLDRR